MKPTRACPVCPECSSKKFERLTSIESVKVRCRSCGKIIEL